MSNVKMTSITDNRMRYNNIDLTSNIILISGNLKDEVDVVLYENMKLLNPQNIFLFDDNIDIDLLSYSVGSRIGSVKIKNKMIANDIYKFFNILTEDKMLKKYRSTISLAFSFTLNITDAIKLEELLMEIEPLFYNTCYRIIVGITHSPK